MFKKHTVLLFSIFILSLFLNTSYAQIYWNQAVGFLGTNYFAVPNSTSLNITGSFSFECWLNPSDTSGGPGNPKQIFGKGSLTNQKYGLLLQSGKVRIRTNGVTRFVGKTGIPPNVWSHVAATYSDASGLFSVYINGVPDTSGVNMNTPSTGSDSLYIGKVLTQSFEGSMDDLRIWNRELSASEIAAHFRSTIAIGTGIYEGLVLSIPFQERNGFGFSFTSKDFSGFNNSAFSREGTVLIDMKNNPQVTNTMNESLELDGTGDYAAAYGVPDLIITNSITLESWIYPRSTAGGYIIHKGSPGFVVRNYGLKVETGLNQISGIINSVNYVSDYSLPVNEWTHVAFKYTSDGNAKMYINGVLRNHFVVAPSVINSNTDSLYIGGTNLSGNFNGYIDEVRIASYAKSDKEIADFMFTSIDKANEPVAMEQIVFNLDGYCEANSGSYSKLNFRNDSRFSQPGTLSNQPVSPLDRADALNFTKGYLQKKSDRLIPASGTAGLMTDDTLTIESDQTISDLNLFIAVNHTLSNDLEISLIGPNGDIADVCFDIGQLGTNDNIVTIFDDNADSTLVSGKYVSISPRIKPGNSLNAMFSGDNSKGLWRLRINDDNAGNTGRLIGWGIQINNASFKPALLSANCLIQGFYNETSNTMVRDTMRFYLHRSYPPYSVADSAKDYLGPLGVANGTFANPNDTGKFYIRLKHRNSLETWSSVPVSFDYLTMQMNYAFRTDITSALGDNMIKVDNSPQRYGIYSGDVNQQGDIDLTDVIIIYNDATLFTTGYKVTDVNGDNFSDLTDVLITNNNAVNFISRVVP